MKRNNFNNICEIRILFKFNSKLHKLNSWNITTKCQSTELIHINNGSIGNVCSNQNVYSIFSNIKHTPMVKKFLKIISYQSAPEEQYYSSVGSVTE